VKREPRLFDGALGIGVEYKVFRIGKARTEGEG
jgi:hypothetical protein